MTTPHTTTVGRQLSWQVIALFVAIRLVAAIAFNAWNDRQQQNTVDVNTDRLLTELCADTPDC